MANYYWMESGVKYGIPLNRINDDGTTDFYSEINKIWLENAWSAASFRQSEMDGSETYEITEADAMAYLKKHGGAQQ